MHYQLYIKNMVCDRCIMVVNEVLEKLDIHPVEVALGSITIAQPLPTITQTTLATNLEKLGFELLANPKSILVSMVKNIIIQHIHRDQEVLSENLSDVIAKHTNHDYKAISTLFSELEGTTIEKYYISQKIERVKELLLYNELTLNQIADDLHYSSVGYLSNQFKKVTGITPTAYKSLNHKHRIPLDKI